MRSFRDNHIIICSTDLDGQHKYRDVKQSAKDLAQISDSLCREHGLSVIEPAAPLKGAPVSRAEWEAARQGKATVRDLIRQDVDEAIRRMKQLVPVL